MLILKIVWIIVSALIILAFYNNSKNCCKIRCGKYRCISHKETKLMINNERAIILDVRTKEEYCRGHIPTAILIPITELEEKADSMLKNTEQTIIVYCKSGRRSKLAISILYDLGYKNVFETDGFDYWEYCVER